MAVNNTAMQAKLNELETLTKACTDAPTLRSLMRAVPHLNRIVTLSFELTREVVSRVLPLEKTP